jgi:hypothetical protein
MEPRLSLGTLICVFVAIAFGVYCLYPSVVLNRRGDEVQRGPTHEHRFVRGSISVAAKGRTTQTAKSSVTAR